MRRSHENRTGRRIATGLLAGILGVAALGACDTGGEAPKAQPTTTAPATGAPAPEHAPKTTTPEAKPNLGADAYDVFDQTAKAIGRTVSCLLSKQAAGGSPAKPSGAISSDYYGNHKSIFGPDGHFGSADDGPQEVEMFIQRGQFEKGGAHMVYFNAITRDIDASSVTATLSTHKTDPVQQGETLSPRLAGAAMDGSHTVALSATGEETGGKAVRWEISRQPQGLYTADGNKLRPAGPEDINQWSTAVQRSLSHMAMLSNAPDCAPLPIPLLDAPGAELTPAERV